MSEKTKKIKTDTELEDMTSTLNYNYIIDQLAENENRANHICFLLSKLKENSEQVKVETKEDAIMYSTQKPVFEEYAQIALEYASEISKELDELIQSISFCSYSPLSSRMYTRPCET